MSVGGAGAARGGAEAARGGRGGWMDAGGEFYQESFPDPPDTHLHTLLPSNQARTSTVRRVRPPAESRGTVHRDHTLAALPDLSENLSNEERTWEEMMQIKGLPLPMAAKIQLKNTLQNATKLRLQGFEQLQWRQRKVWHSVRAKLAELFAKMSLWHSSLKVIEGNFGTGVVSYFLFLRWLLFLNFGVGLLITLFLILPNSFLKEVTQTCDESALNSSICCSQSYLNKNYTQSGWFLDTLQGSGYMEYTMLFYGVYSNQVFEYRWSLIDGSMYYDMPAAYVLVPVVWCAATLIAIVKSSARGLRDRLVESEGQFYKYCNLVFGGWDFCINNDKSANIKHKALFNEIRGALQEERFKEEKQSRSKETIFILYLKRITINLLVFAILIGSGYVIFLTINFSIDNLEASSRNETARFLRESLFDTTFSLSQLQSLVLEFLPYIVIVVLNIVVPVVLGSLIRFEEYTPAQVVIIILLRTVLLRLSSLTILMSQIYLHVASNKLICSSQPHDSNIECWETYLGQQLYKLIITDFVIQFITTFFINMPRAFLAKHTQSKFCKLIGEQDFYLPKHVLDIVYIQTVVWMGTFFCPFLPIIGFVYYFLVFYIKKFNCLYNSTPASTLYRASKSKSLFMSVLLLSYAVSIIPVAYSIAEILPSINCGPYRDYTSVWSYLVQSFETLPSVIRELVFLLGTSTFAVPAFAVLLLLLYYYWAVAAANRHMVTVLRGQLVLEGHDKQYLLTRLSAYIRQRQSKDRRERDDREDLSTHRHSST